MFDRIFANYLVEKGKLSEQNVEVIFSTKDERRVRLGVIAVAEKFITVEQADEINQLQAIQDKRFGDIAIANGYLTEEQLTHILALQGNTFLAFEQAVIDHGCLTMEEIEQALSDYQTENALSEDDMTGLKSCETERILPVFLSDQPKILSDLAGVMIRTVCRLVDYRAYIQKPYVTTEVPYSFLSKQEIFGAHSILNSLSGDSEALKAAAIGFAGTDFINDTDDSLDALCELINSVNGMFASQKSQEGIDLDMKVPEYHMTEGSLKGASLLCIPLVVFGNQKLTVTLSLDDNFSK